MNKFKIHIPATTHEELQAALKETAYILTGLSESVNAFDRDFGHKAADKKKYWKEKADEWKAKYKVNQEEN